MIFIAESKLDDTFRNSEFNVENYHLHGVQTEMQAVADF
jgi:hypothetical protein